MTNTKITAEVTLTNKYEYEDYSFSYYGTTKYIYTMQDAEGTVYVWKTTAFLQMKTGEKDQYGNDLYQSIKKNDRFTITATVKGQSEYKGQPQTELTRVKVVNILEEAEPELTWEEKIELKKQEQLDSLQGDDFIWKMPYRQYKEYYSDCETVAGSFIRPDHDVPQIEVIIREGRLKNSGVRGQHFITYFFKNEEGNCASYYAVSYENAYRRCIKEHPDHQWELEMVIR